MLLNNNIAFKTMKKLNAYYKKISEQKLLYKLYKQDLLKTNISQMQFEELLVDEITNLRSDCKKILTGVSIGIVLVIILKNIF